MKTLTLGESGQIALPQELRERYGLASDTRVRVIETRSGILLVPQTDAPMSAELTQELSEWQRFPEWRSQLIQRSGSR